MSREKNVFEKFPKKWPKGPFGKPVRGKRRNHGLPSGVKGGENMDLEHHYRHKQHTFDAFRAVSLEACFTCTGTAAYKYIQISAVLSSVQADGDILRQQLVFHLILVGIFLVDRTSRAPLGRSVLFSPSVIVLRGEIDADGDPVHQKQSEDSFYTVLTKLYLEWVLHHRSELLNQSGQSIL